MKKSIRLSTLVILCLSLAAIPVYSEEPIELQPVEVSASRLKTTAKKYAGSIKIITEKEIKQSGELLVENILRDQLGVNIFKQGGVGGESTIRLRGADQKSVLVVIDGARVNSNSSGGFDLRNLNTENIERIEILRGSQTPVWGADAVGGVINIITKKGRGTPSHYFSFEGGSFGTFIESLGSSGIISDFDYSISASRTDIAGYSDFNENRIIENGGTPENDNFENTSLTSRLGTQFADNGRIEFIGRYTRANSSVDNTTGDRDRDNKVELFYLAFPISKPITSWWDIKMTPTMAYNETDVDTASKTIFNRTYIADLQNNISINDYFSTVFGVEIRAQNARNNGRDFTQNTFNQGYFLQTQFDWKNRVLLTAGFRKDINEIFEDPLTYRFDGAYNFEQWDFRIRGAYATGFRAPTFNDLTFPGSGNIDLNPEKSKSFEVGIDKDLFNKLVQIELTFFNIEFEDLIAFQTSTTPTLNIGRAKSRGIEAHIGVDLPYNLHLSNNYTWTEAVDEIDDVPLSRRPKHQYSATLSHNWKNKLYTGLTIRARSGVLDNSSGSRTVPGFATIRAVISYQLNENLEISARGENILNKEYEEIARRGTSDAAGYAGFTYKFK
jgi:vitamin B12 transporter